MIYCGQLESLLNNLVLYSMKEEMDNYLSVRKELLSLLSELRTARITLVQLDFSVLPDFGKYANDELEFLSRELFKARANKNLLLERKKFREAMDKEVTENLFRARLNAEMCKQMFGHAARFYEVGSRRIGFIYSGNKLTDDQLDAIIKAAYRRVAVLGKQIILELSEEHKIIKEEKIERSLRNVA